MKKLIIITSILVMSLSSGLMAKTGFSLGLLIPIGASFSSFSGNDAQHIKSDAGFEFGIHVQPAYYFGFEYLSFGLGLDLGYNRDVFAFKAVIDEKSKGGIAFDSLMIGVLPRIDIAFVSIGVGAGVKIPLAGSSYFRESDGGYTSQGYDFKKIGENFKNPYIPYVKAVVDFLLPYNIVVGAYFSYDIPLIETKNPSFHTKLSAFDLGAEIGLRF
ncbi:hypothetical protein [Brachyspira hyodysenteriae]|uniref:Outer membrane protein beta-barrel domain-containing protein n=1 Tax=Brachyspira hyodysenteriae ATCC 27164 TaxID=1266923 RepID=A0A3B6VRA6_BRAHO|nr:hypothetical protein [Brachyspira hyodysenteriae]ANN63420.1 hypothetical protein BHYOB78_05940 [Brachyspira hyodysenteriae ATCC 27164]KLI21236.1 hypothetical protein SU43_10145 [Brachyspira hyodysenteriae]KLI24480.1 hypothetical protein SZ47_09535 [Brachyspira hyodysenteriae]KLI45558.1 hypothetical protein SZ41_13480 [Brachyspira hyodysenteriae]MCZ9925490.1 hypothetical protein [Brachyspira hyodysenteriae]